MLRFLTIPLAAVVLAGVPCAASDPLPVAPMPRPVGLPAGTSASISAPLSSFSGRTEIIRTKLMREYGANADSERAVALGLAWLARQQKQDGSWEFDAGDKDDRAAATGLVLLPFLAVSQTHKDEKAKYQQAVAAGLDFLKKRCPTTGAKAGQFEGATTMTGQALAALALCEAYGMTRDAELKPVAQAGLNFIQKNQAKDGGWSDKPGGKSDLAVVGWQIQALSAGRLTNDLVVDNRIIKNAVKFLDGVSAGSRKSMYGPTDNADAKPGTLPTAIGLWCRYHIDGWGPSHPGLIDGVAGLAKSPPSETNRDPLYLYYAAWVLLRYEGEDWKNWNEGPKAADGSRKGGMRDLLFGLLVRKDGAMLGSWDANGDSGRRFGRLGTTALNVLTLEVYYRYLPLYKRGADGNAVQILEDE
ncbi:MAG: hypothetical protein J0I06_04430 [Planctomycetes bacterium]|nr:hypothetical protein [Planctomycetota bacterium]